MSNHLHILLIGVLITNLLMLITGYRRWKEVDKESAQGMEHSREQLTWYV